MASKAVCLLSLLIAAPSIAQTKPNSPYLFVIEDTSSNSKGKDVEDKNVSPNKSDRALSSAIEQQVKERRGLCGWGDLESSGDILNASAAHANYMQYFDEHSKKEILANQLSRESYLKNNKNVSHKNNPYFTGEDYGQRLDKARYYSYATTGVESIVSVKGAAGEDLQGKIADTLDAAFSTPITMKAIFDQNSQHIGATFRTYNTRLGDNKNVLLISLGDGAQPNKVVTSKSGLLTYPCDSSSPVPFKPVASLSAQTSPSMSHTTTGSLQPIYIKSGESAYIDIFDVLLVDQDRNIEIPTQVVTSESKPSAIFSEKNIGLMDDNEAFIVADVGNTYIELCDDYFEECRREKDALQPNTTYKVSFTMSDNYRAKRHTISFKTLPDKQKDEP